MKIFKEKSLISFLLIAVLMISSFSVSVYAEDPALEVEEEEFISDLEEGSITGEGESPDELRQDDTDETTVVAPPSEDAEIEEDVPGGEPGEEEFSVPDTVAYRFFRAAGFLAPEMYDIPAKASMTRAQFITIAAKLCNIPALTSFNNPFWDVPSTHWSAPYIYAMRDLGYVNGYSETEFKPDAPITWGQILKITVDILGYGKVALEQYGEYPKAYVIQAAQIHLPLSGVDVNAEANYTMVLDFLMEAAQTEMLLHPEIKKGEEVLSVSNQTLLSKYHEIYEDEGVMSYNGETGLSSDVGGGRDKVIIGGRLLDRNKLYVRDFLGMNISYFYQVGTGGDNVLLYAEVKDKDENVLIIDRENLAVDHPRFSVNNICYYDQKGKLKMVSIDPLARFIYNGRAKDNFDVDDYDIEAGTLKLISYKGGNNYDVIVANEFENCFVSMVDTAGKRLHDVYGASNGKVLNLEDYKNVEIYKNGIAVDISDINKNDVVSYMADEKKELIILHVMAEKVSGVVAIGTGTVLKDKAFIIDGVEYRLAANVRRAINGNRFDFKEPEAGMKYEFYLDFGGRVGGMTEIEQKIRYSLLCNHKKGEGMDRNRTILQLVLDNGDLTEAQISEKLILIKPQTNGAGEVVLDADGRVLTEELRNGAATQVIDAVLDSYTKFTLVKVRFNGLGEVIRLELAEDPQMLKARQKATGNEYFKDNDYNWNYGYNAEAFTLDYYNENAQHRGSSIMSFVGHYRMNPDTVVFNIPCYDDIEDVDPKEITVIESVNVWHGAQYKAALYDADATLSAAAAVVSPVYPSYFNGLFVVDKVYQAENNKGETVLKVSGWQKGVYLSLVEKSSDMLINAKKKLLGLRPDLNNNINPAQVMAGDVFRLASEEGEITGAQLFYSCSGEKIPFIGLVSTPTDTRLFSSATIAVGQVYAMSPYAISTINPEKYTDYTNKFYGKISTHTLYNTVVTVYDRERNMVTLGSLADVDVPSLPYMDGTLPDAENSNSWVLIYRSGDMVYEMVVIK